MHGTKVLKNLISEVLGLLLLLLLHFLNLGKSFILFGSNHFSS